MTAPARATILVGEVRERLRSLPDGHFHCGVTSPPYHGLRSYSTDPQLWGGSRDCEHVWEIGTKAGMSGGTASVKVQTKGTENFQIVPDSVHATCSRCQAWLGELGSEDTVSRFILNLVEVFAEVQRVLRDDGVLFINIGDSYARPAGKGQHRPGDSGKQSYVYDRGGGRASATTDLGASGLREKSMCLIPQRLSIALADAGWIVRSIFPWIKKSAMPESVEDRPSNALEWILMLTKSGSYYWDQEAVRVPGSGQRGGPSTTMVTACKNGDRHFQTKGGLTAHPGYSSRNRRNTDWYFDSLRAERDRIDALLRDGGLVLDDDGEPLALDVCPKGSTLAHFASFPEALVRPLILAASSEKGCCPAEGCGAPWKRTTHRDKAEARVGPKILALAKTGIGNNGTGGSSLGVPARPTYTTGWTPSCSHDLPPIPCRILDIFAGTGTTLAVAVRHGRDATGIELNPDYAEIARGRLNREAGLWTPPVTVAVPAAPEPAAPSLLDLMEEPAPCL